MFDEIECLKTVARGKHVIDGGFSSLGPKLSPAPEAPHPPVSVSQSQWDWET